VFAGRPTKHGGKLNEKGNNGGEMVKKGKKYYCDSCGKELDKEKDFIRCVDPYMEEVIEEILITDLCEECYTERVQEI